VVSRAAPALARGFLFPGPPGGCRAPRPGSSVGRAARSLGRAAAPLVATLAATALAAAPAAPAGAETVAIVGATVHTLGPAGTLAGATVVIAEGRIAAVGAGVEVPAGARVIDAGGRVVTPGLFDSVSQIGIVEVSQEEESRDSEVDDPRVTAAYDVADAVNPRSALVAVNRVEGLTRALVAPRPGAAPIAGRAAVIDLGGGAGPGGAGDSLVKSPAALLVTLGEVGAGKAGGSRAAALLRLREALEDARDFARNREAWERAARRPYALSRLDLAALAPVVEGELPVAAVVHRASDIEAVLRLAADYRLRLVVVGGAEAWQVGPALARAGVPVVVNPLDNLPDRFERLGATLENAARLHAAGVTVAFTSGESHNGRNLRQAAGNAVAYGLPWETALRAMTANPARIWGIDAAYGTLEPGKDADLVVWDGDPLEVTTTAERVFIRGAEVPMASRQTLLRDRYRDLARPLPPAYALP
jgi:imidazolonepropionase-like amidohydrolase